jgi:hypothetical protein
MRSSGQMHPPHPLRLPFACCRLPILERIDITAKKRRKKTNGGIPRLEVRVEN